MSGANVLVAMDINTESVVWMNEITDFDGDIPYRPLYVVDDHIYVTGEIFYEESSSLLAINRYTGVTEKTLNFNRFIMSTPKIHNNNLIIPLAARLQAYDLSNWTLVWNLELSGDDGYFGIGAITLAGNVVAFHSRVEDNGTNELYPYDLAGVDAKTGAILWSRPNGDFSAYPFDPQSDDTTIYSAYSYYSGFGGFSR